MAVNPRIEYFWRDLLAEYCQGLESHAVYTAPPFFVASVHGISNRSIPHLPLHMHAEDIIPTFLTSNIFIEICFSKALTLTRLRPYEMFKLLLIVSINNTVSLWGILNFRLRRDAFPYRLVRRIPLKVGVPYPLQSKIGTPPPYLRWTILALQISLNAWLPPHPLHCNGQ